MINPGGYKILKLYNNKLDIKLNIKRYISEFVQV